MDTKLKKINKKKVLAITLCILIPALVLVAMYPMMERAMKEYYDQRTEELDESRKNETYYEMELEGSFVNYAMEASYYLYGRLYQERHNQYVDFGALEEYGWINDYYVVQDSTEFYAEYDDGEVFCQNTDNSSVKKLLKDPNEDIVDELYENGMMGYLTISFDKYGNIDDITFDGVSGLLYNDRLYQEAMDSVNQYEINAKTYMAENGLEELTEEEDDGIIIEQGSKTEDSGDERETDETSLESKQESFGNWKPKNFKAVFVVNENSSFVWYYDVNDSYIGSYFDMYMETGAWVLVLIAAILVAVAALILPFFKQLETGWEKLFSIPAEIIAILALLAIGGIVLMMEAMSCSTMMNIQTYIEWNGDIKFLGTVLSAQFCYGSLLVVNFLGWAVVFFMEYIVAAAFRQFLCGPVYYLKNRFLVVRFGKWCWNVCKKIYQNVTAIDITDNLTKSILKIVGVNLIILIVLCCMWVFGLPGLILYSIGLYILLQKQGTKIKEQYQTVLNGLKQMAEGNLKVEIEEELGLFIPMGKELSRVQEGFSKAVAEEAKSQNMKTELITNVSHDLKTPLTAIITYVDLLKQEGITDEARASYIATLDQKSQRLKVLIEDLFEVSKANSGNIKMNYMEVDIVSLMKQVRSEMEQQIAESTLNFRWNLPDEKVVLQLDGQRTYRVFENLINNILKYSMPYSRVYIDILPTESEVQILFRNMSAAELNFDVNRLTDRFVRGDASRNTEGSGLGLAIAKSFVELQKGSFQIEVDGDLFKVKIAWKR